MHRPTEFAYKGGCAGAGAGVGAGARVGAGEGEVPSQERRMPRVELSNRPLPPMVPLVPPLLSAPICAA